MTDSDRKAMSAITAAVLALTCGLTACRGASGVGVHEVGKTQDTSKRSGNGNAPEGRYVPLV